jgi:hypothetical protein
MFILVDVSEPPCNAFRFKLYISPKMCSLTQYLCIQIKSIAMLLKPQIYRALSPLVNEL